MQWPTQLARAELTRALARNAARRRLKSAARRKAIDPNILEATLNDAFTLVRMLKQSGRSVEGRTVLEVGSGRLPLIPIIFALLGAKRVVLADYPAVRDPKGFLVARNFVLDHASRVGSKLDISVELIFARLCD